jgi:hypothetical protein
VNTAANMELFSSEFREGKPMLRIIALQLWKLCVRLREEYKLYMEVLSRNEVIRGRRKLHRPEFKKLFAPYNIVKVIT